MHEDKCWFAPLHAKTVRRNPVLGPEEPIVRRCMGETDPRSAKNRMVEMLRVVMPRLD